MAIRVDADACPVKNQIISIAKKYHVAVHLYADVNHILESDDAIIHVCDQGADSVDLALINDMNSKDIVVSADYGVASLALARKGYVLHPNGKEIHSQNIDALMFERHIGREERQRGRRSSKIKKRTKEDDTRFCNALELLLKNKDYQL